MNKQVTTAQIMVVGLGFIVFVAYLYSRHKQAAAFIPVTTPAKAYTPPLVLRSSGNTAQGVNPVLHSAANPGSFQPTDAFGPGMLFNK